MAIIGNGTTGVILFLSRHPGVDLLQVDLMNFRVEYVRPRSGRCLLNK